MDASVKGGVNITTVKFQSQLLQVETALAFALVLIGLICKMSAWFIKRSSVDIPQQDKAMAVAAT